MKPLALPLPLRPISIFPNPSYPLFFYQPKPLPQPRIFRVLCSSLQSKPVKVEDAASSSKPEYKPGFLDHLFLNLFRNKLVQEVGWDSEKPGYDGLIEVANRLMMKGRTNSDTREATVRILVSLFPPFLLELYRILITPIGGGKVAAMMVARVTALTCQWLMGTCTVNSVDLPDGTSCRSGVFVDKCKYLEESKCVGICINTCKLPTQNFFKDYMGIPLLMEPNFSDYSCQAGLISLLFKHFMPLISLNLGFFLHWLKMISPSRSLAWRYAQMPLNEERSPEPWMYHNAQKPKYELSYTLQLPPPWTLVVLLWGVVQNT